jgi:4a-hydroxytetrahydrobiopterin dehydratase
VTATSSPSPLSESGDWREVDGALEREFRFADFAEALAFVNRVGEAAETANHHPDIEIHWNRVKLRWWTHVANAITDRDREMALKTDELV